MLFRSIDKTGLSAGTYYLYSVDTAGNLSLVSSTGYTFTDTPPASGTLGLTNYTDSGSSTTDQISTDNTFDLTISGNEAGTTVTYEVSTDGGTSWTPTTASQSGLTDGTYKFRATVTDSAGNRNTKHTRY